MARYQHLLAPGSIGTMSLRNRILMAPMGEELAELDGSAGAQQVAYLEARAAGGAALVTLGSVAVAWPQGTSNRHQNGLNLDRFEPGIRALVDAAHRHGAKLALQISHMGKVARNDIIAGRPMWVPSLPRRSGFDPLLMMMTPDEMRKSTEEMMGPDAKASFHEMTHDDIATLIGWFADAVERAKAWGVDGIELHAGHGYILDEFLSSASNARTDEYGGDIAGRARLLLETIAAIRDRVGRDYPLWARINALEFFTEGANSLDDALALAPMLETAGLDAIHVSAYADSNVAIGFTESHTAHTPGRLVEYAKKVKQAVTIPVIAVGRIEPDVAEQLLAEGAVDFITMGRKLLADPELPNKLAQDEPHDARPCMYHYRCIGNIFTREGVRCVANPMVGREHELALEPAAIARRVVVVGGGPAGMETARLAALRGHHVTLFEAHEQLGGQLALAARTYDPNADFLAWQLRQIDRLDIDVRLGTLVDASQIAALSPDAVVDATGGRWTRPDIPGIDSDHVLDIASIRPWVLDGQPLPGRNVVILGGGRAGCGLATLAHRQGYNVTLIEGGDVLASQFGMPGRWRIVHDLMESGVTVRRSMGVTSVAATMVHGTGTDGDESFDADAVIVVTAVEARAAIVDDEGTDYAVYRVGDCSGARFLEGSLREATEVALAL